MEQSQDYSIIPFGKFRGKSIHEKDIDPKFIRWCLIDSRNFVGEKYPGFYNELLLIEEEIMEQIEFGEYHE